MSSVDPGRRRYPGVRAFDEADADQFFGRPGAADELLLRVLAVRLVLQFAPSGVGKTSLLQAGLFPRLRGHDCLPVGVRLNRPDEPLAAAVRRSLVEAAERGRLRDPVIPQGCDDIVSLIAGTQLWSDELALLTPVLTFDQFEEVFTLRDEAFRQAFAREIGTLVGVRPGAAAGDRGPGVRVIISLREEFLGRLELFSREIPELFVERLRLSPLSPDDAREAIVQPAALEGEGWASPRFEYEPDCVAALLEFVGGTSDLAQAVEPLTLQLVCSHAEALVIRRTAANEAPRPLTLADFGGNDGLKRLVAEHYDSVIGRLPGASIRRRARAMFERGLLDPAGKRLMQEEDEIKRDFGLDRQALDPLVAGGLLRREPRNTSLYYEISHDRMAEAVARRRGLVLPRWVLPTLAGSALVIAMLVAGVAFVVSERAKTQQALDATEQAYGLLLGDDLVLRLQDAGEGEALRAALDRINPAAGAPQVPPGASRARLLGDQAFRRGTLADTRAHYDSAMAMLRELPSPGTRDQRAVRAEIARLNGRLGQVESDAGNLRRARELLESAAAIWTELLAGQPTLGERLDATELFGTLAGLLRAEPADAKAAETWTARTVEAAFNAWTEAHVQQQSGERELQFEQGRALQLLADAVLSRAMLWWSEPDTFAAADALAKAALRARPLSAGSTRLLVTASSMAGIMRGGVPRPEPPVELTQAARQLADLVQTDPADLRIQRERAAVVVLLGDQFRRCFGVARCRAALSEARIKRQMADLQEAASDLRWLSSRDPVNMAWRGDVGWALSSQAQLHRAAGNAHEALRMYDQAIEQYRHARGADLSSDNVGTVAGLLLQRAEVLAGLGQSAAADASMRDADGELKALGTAALASWREVDLANTRSDLLERLGRHAEARAAGQRAAQASARDGAPWDASRNRAIDACSRANALVVQGDGPDKAHALEHYQAALQLYRSAVSDLPMDPVIWDSVRIAHQRIAELSPDPKDEAEQAARARNLASAVAAATVAHVLSVNVPEPQRAERDKALYLAKRDLGTHQERFGRNEFAHRLARDGVLQSHALLDSAGANQLAALWQLRDAYVNLGLRRYNGNLSGWEEPIRIGLDYGRRLAMLEPANVEHVLFLGEFQVDLAYMVDKSARHQDAAVDFAAARDPCQRALKLASDDPIRTRAQKCLDEATQAR